MPAIRSALARPWAFVPAAVLAGEFLAAGFLVTVFFSRPPHGEGCPQATTAGSADRPCPAALQVPLIALALQVGRSKGTPR